MPVATIVTGKDAVVTFTESFPTSGSAVVIKNSHFTLVEGPPVVEAFNTTDGVLRGSGIPDASGTVEGFVDGSNPISKQVRGGMIGTLKLALSPTEFYQLTAILGQITVDSGGMNEPEKWSFPYMLQSGTVTTPV